MPQYRRRATTRKTYRKAPLKNSKAKALVTGERNKTYLEQVASGAGAVARLARSIAPVVAAINTEHKYFDTAASATFFNPGTGDQIVALTTGIAQGLTDITRIGDSILAKDIAIKINLLWLASTTVHQSHTRVTLICWKENIQINAPTAAKIFSQPAIFLSAFNKDYTDQFVVMDDQVFCNQAQISAATNQAPNYLKLYHKLDWHMRFIDATANGASTNHLYLVFRNTGATSANQGACDFFARLNYTDN